MGMHRSRHTADTWPHARAAAFHGGSGLMSAETITKLVPLFQIHSTSWEAGRVPAQEWCRLPTSFPPAAPDSRELGCPAVPKRI